MHMLRAQYRNCELMDSRLLTLLVCPRDHTKLRIKDSQLCCSAGHKYPVLDGVPVLLLAEKDQTIGVAPASLEAADKGVGGPLYAATLGLSDEEKRGVELNWTKATEIDPVI